MKKIIALLVTFYIALVAGCSGLSSPEMSSNSSDSDGTKLKIGVIQPVEHTSLDEIRTACLNQLTARGYDSTRVEIDYQNASGDTSNLNPIVQRFVGGDYDLIIAIATPAAQAAAAATQNIPIVFAAVTDPVAAGLVADPAHPSRNITGTSDAIPVGSIFQMANRLTPAVKSFGFLYNSGEPNSISVIKQAKDYCQQNNIVFNEAIVTNTGEVQQAALHLLTKVDAIFISIDNTVAPAMPVVGSLCVEAGKPCYVAADSLVRDGGLASIGVNYTDLGNQTADMAIEILEGAAIADVPVRILQQFNEVINDEVADALNIER